MKLEFEHGTITIQADASNWGPFSFNFEPALPENRTLQGVTVTSYLGRVKPGDSDVLSTMTDTTAELIQSASVVSDYIVNVYFNRPTTAAYVNQKHTLVFKFTMDTVGGAGEHSAFFYAVSVI